MKKPPVKAVFSLLLRAYFVIYLHACTLCDVVLTLGLKCAMILNKSVVAPYCHKAMRNNGILLCN